MSPSLDVSLLVDLGLLDVTTRPTCRTAEPAEHDEAMRADGPHLVDIHDRLRAELAQVRDVLEQVDRGQMQVSQARSVVNARAMRQKNWTLGAFCESSCHLVTGHHTLEDRAVFPGLRAAEPALDRLEEENQVIHDVLDAFDRALIRLVDEDTPEEDALSAVHQGLDALTDPLLSHLAYEERELLEPLSRHGYR